MWRAAGLAHLQRHCPRAPSLSPNLTVVGARGQQPLKEYSGFQSAQLEPGLLRDTKLLQRVLACHLLDFTPIEDEAPAHELVAGPSQSLYPLLTLCVTAALKVVFSIRVFQEACGGR